MRHVVVSLAVVLCAAPGVVRAQSPGEAELPLPEPSVPESVEEFEYEHEYRNSISLFLGATREDEEGVETVFTFGLEYARRLAPQWSVVGVVERAGGEIGATVLLGQATYNPIGGLVLATGPGMEIRDGRSEEGPEEFGGEEEREHAEGESEGTSVDFVWRIGLLYEFRFDRFIVAPTIDVDFVARDAVLVFGANLGYEF